MSGAGYELQKLIYETLRDDSGVNALVAGRIYDGRPENAVFPNITFGPVDVLEDDADCIDGEEHNLQLDIWSRDNARMGPCKTIIAAVKAALHRAVLTLPDPDALALIEVPSARVMLDPDGITAHGVVRVRALVEI